MDILVTLSKLSCPNDSKNIKTNIYWGLTICQTLFDYENMLFHLIPQKSYGINTVLLFPFYR